MLRRDDEPELPMLMRAAVVVVLALLSACASFDRAVARHVEPRSTEWVRVTEAPPSAPTDMEYVWGGWLICRGGLRFDRNTRTCVPRPKQAEPIVVVSDLPGFVGDSGGGSSGSSYSGGSGGSARSSPGTDVRVRAYTRGDGTYVRSHTRSRPRR